MAIDYKVTKPIFDTDAEQFYCSIGIGENLLAKVYGMDVKCAMANTEKLLNTIKYLDEIEEPIRSNCRDMGWFKRVFGYIKNYGQ